MGRALTPGSTLSHYRIISPLGAGGMGEVYLAQDLSLERSVALKILPPTVVRNEERVRRFMQEAKAASALNHPHIVTIYEIGQGEAHAPEGDSAHTPTAGEAAGTPIHYIAMELVGGDTLGHAIHHEQTDLRGLLGYLAQVADGLAKAHAAGIVHRDLKPDNIMIAKDGYAKVLDFGLAKLTERQESSADETSMATQTRAKTMEGVVMGTVGYMSPEQVQGKAVDHRSDIFSFGCILYEAATRRRPFTADSNIETMHKILSEKPAPVEELNPEVPGELRRLIRRCLAKAPEQRLQSIKDLAIELHEIVDEFETLSLSSVTRTSGTSTSIAAAPSRRGPGARLGIAAVALIGVAGIGFGIYGLMHRNKGAARRPDSFQSMQMTRLTTSGNVFGAAISADGRYLAESLHDKGLWGLWVKQVETGSQVQILPSQATLVVGISFSPDGNYVYYLGRDREADLYSVLFQVPSLGGTPRKLLFDVDTAVTFSPDGKQVAFVRGYPQLGESALMVANADGSAERKLSVLKRPLSFRNLSPSWSPDGRSVAAAVGGAVDFVFVVVDVGDGKQTPLGTSRWRRVQGVAWLPDGSALIATASSLGGALNRQIWEIAYPGGEIRRITNDLNQYGGVSITSDGRRIATVQYSRTANLWIAPAADPSAAKQITFGSTREDAIDEFSLTRDGTSLIVSTVDRYIHVHALGRDGAKRQLTTGASFNVAPIVARNSDLIVFTSLREDKIPHVWKMDTAGGGLSQVTQGTGEEAFGVDPSGRWAYFRRVDTMEVLWRISLAGGEPEKVAEPILDFVGVSPDGTRLAYGFFRQEGGIIHSDIAVIPAGGGQPLATLPVPSDVYSFDWSPSGDAIDYVRSIEGEWDIWRQPLAGGEPKRLTDFGSSEQIYDFHWSADGTQLYLARGKDTSDVVLISDFR